MRGSQVVKADPRVQFFPAAQRTRSREIGRPSPVFVTNDRSHAHAACPYSIDRRSRRCTATAVLPASAQAALRFKPYDTLGHFVSVDFERHASRADPAPNDHTRQERVRAPEPHRCRPNLQLLGRRWRGDWRRSAIPHRLKHEQQLRAQHSRQEPATSGGVVILEPACPKGRRLECHPGCRHARRDRCVT